MEKEVVEKRKWISSERFFDLVGATNLIPGPNSTQMTMHCGREYAGYLGLWIAGLAFIIPTASLTLLVAYIFTEFGSLPGVEGFFFGIKPVVMGLIFGACLKLAKKGFKTKTLIYLGILVTIASILGINEFALIIGSGLVYTLFIKSSNFTWSSIIPLLSIASLSAKPIASKSLFLSFLKIACILYGSGYVLIAYLDAEMITNQGWITKEQLLDTVAMGQYTPGPILTTATFVGYQLNGFSGAV